jgi:deoxyribodipyrimidine photolyase/predicted NAD/FAD-dependent oxidoreductase
MMDIHLPPHLDERCLTHEGPVSESPSIVVHWMRAALRLDENPTFDVARTIAKKLGLPLLIYQGIDERYPHASYRHHRFLLEGAADVALRAKEIGVKHVLHVARDGHREPYLLQLADEAAVIVTDLVDLSPWSDWTNSVARIRTVIEVDAHCVLPRPVFGRTCDRPFRFRDATKREMKRRMTRPWPISNQEIIPLPEIWTPPFTPVEASVELNKDGARSLLSTCQIDPTVVPVTDMVGGASAGLARWNAYLENGLSRYHRTRNNAAMRNGVSGISPWLHHGMIAATRLVRDAAESGTKGAEKFLDEMLVFREHAYHHSHATDQPSEWGHLPSWARDTWKNSTPAQDPLFKMDIERGKSNDALWDAAQVGMVRHGIMHNNVRMTWGKGTVHWVDDPETAMRLTQDLNDRYALDGRNPNSIAGVMWCFGLFDRPFDPPDLRMGRVRRRDSRDHAARLDIERYKAWTEAPTGGRKLNIGIVGGGLSGRFTARLLSDLGHDVIVYDKGQRASGRLSDRRAGDGTPFQIGAPKIDSWPNWAKRHVQDWIDRGFLEADGENPESTLPHLLEYLGKGLLFRQQHRVYDVEVEPNRARLQITTPEGPLEAYHDHVIVAVPLEQSKALTKTTSIELCGRSESCWVAWGPCSTSITKAPKGWILTRKGIDRETLEVRIDGAICNTDLERSLPSMAAHVATTLDINPDGWSAHLWRYSRPIDGPKKVIHQGPISIIGDAFGSPIGTAGGALDSAARAVADLHCSIGWQPSVFQTNSRQTNFSEWEH